MTTDPASRLRADLLRNTEQLAALEADRERIMDAAESSNADDEHDPEGATIAFEREQLASLVERALRTRTEIESALAAIEAGTYGVCVTCGRPIGDERLEARPHARTCITCAV